MKPQDKLISTYMTGIIMGIIIGACICLAGLILILLGLAGSIDWLVNVGSFSSRLINASPGVFFAVIGLIIILVYKPKIRYNYKHEKTSGGSSSSGSGGLFYPQD